eukprot:12939225-Prorocentrum_lima.AAC.1
MQTARGVALEDIPAGEVLDHQVALLPEPPSMPRTDAEVEAEAEAVAAAEGPRGPGRPRGGGRAREIHAT